MLDNRDVYLVGRWRRHQLCRVKDELPSRRSFNNTGVTRVTKNAEFPSSLRKASLEEKWARMRQLRCTAVQSGKGISSREQPV